jgi:hypothetical protein
MVAMLATVGLIVWNRSVRRPHRTSPVVAAPAFASAIASTAAAPSIAAPVIAPPPAATNPVVGLPAVEPTPAQPVVATAAGEEAAAECDSAFAEHRWTSVATACAAAFQQRPRDSALAMRVAQAQHRRGYLADAGQWASRAIALDADLPEAFVIQAHAAALAGETGAATTAYRRYLALAPHGWHSAEAHQALGRLKRLSRNDAAR